MIKVVLRVYFGKKQEERGLEWFEYSYISSEKSRSKYLITYAFVATHNHFVLDRGGKVFKQSAPVAFSFPQAPVRLIIFY